MRQTTIFGSSQQQQHQHHQESSTKKPRLIPLSSRLRPTSLEEFHGQSDQLATLSKLVEPGTRLHSMIIFGPPGCGKTSFCRLIAKMRASEYTFHSVSATTGSAAELKEALAQCRRSSSNKSPVVFVDEIHRLNKAQQEVLLPAIEDDGVVLFGCTTENPSFALVGALLSRCRLVPFSALPQETVRSLLARAAPSLLPVRFSDAALDALSSRCGGDVRAALDAMERCAERLHGQDETSSLLMVEESDVATQWGRGYVVRADGYDCISALHKSIRGGDANASIYWTVRMAVRGDSPDYIARRLIRAASEDIGLADAAALPLAIAAGEACRRLGMPECLAALCHAASYLALAPKSTHAYKAMSAWEEFVKREPDQPPPPQVLNAPTKLMKEMGRGEGYIYTPDAQDEEAAMRQQYLPESLQHLPPMFDISGLKEHQSFGQKWKLLQREQKKE